MNQFLEVAGGICEGLGPFLVSSGFPALYVDADKDKGIFDFASRMYFLALFRKCLYMLDFPSMLYHVYCKPLQFSKTLHRHNSITLSLVSFKTCQLKIKVMFQKSLGFWWNSVNEGLDISRCRASAVEETVCYRNPGSCLMRDAPRLNKHALTLARPGI